MFVEPFCAVKSSAEMEKKRYFGLHEIQMTLFCYHPLPQDIIVAVWICLDFTLNHNLLFQIDPFIIIFLSIVVFIQYIITVVKF